MLVVVRVNTTPYGCFGILFKDEHPFCWTLEDHEKMLPEGEYKVRRKGQQIEICNDCDPAFFTVGTTREEADGNILLGLRVFSPRCLAESKKAVSEFLKTVKTLKEDVLVIRRPT